MNKIKYKNDYVAFKLEKSSANSFNCLFEGFEFLNENKRSSAPLSRPDDVKYEEFIKVKFLSKYILIGLRSKTTLYFFGPNDDRYKIFKRKYSNFQTEKNEANQKLFVKITKQPKNKVIKDTKFWSELIKSKFLKKKKSKKKITIIDSDSDSDTNEDNNSDNDEISQLSSNETNTEVSDDGQRKKKKKKLLSWRKKMTSKKRDEILFCDNDSKIEIVNELKRNNTEKKNLNGKYKKNVYKISHPNGTVKYIDCETDDLLNSKKTLLEWLLITNFKNKSNSDLIDKKMSLKDFYKMESLMEVKYYSKINDETKSRERYVLPSKRKNNKK